MTQESPGSVNPFFGPHETRIDKFFRSDVRSCRICFDQRILYKNIVVSGWACCQRRFTPPHPLPVKFATSGFRGGEDVHGSCGKTRIDRDNTKKDRQGWRKGKIDGREKEDDAYG